MIVSMLFASTFAATVLIDTNDGDKIENELGYKDYNKISDPTNASYLAYLAYLKDILGVKEKYISTAADLAMVGSDNRYALPPTDTNYDPSYDKEWPLNGIYYLTNDIVFGPDDDFTDGGIDITATVVQVGTTLTVTLEPSEGTVAPGLMARFDDISGVVSDEVNNPNVTTLTNVKQREYALGMAGAIMVDGTPHYFAYGIRVDAGKGNQTITETFNSNGNFAPIGTFNAPFTGIFNGYGYTIDGMAVSVFNTLDAYGGLFGCIQNALIVNIGMEEHCSVNVISTTANAYAGGIVARGLVLPSADAYITDCYNNGAVSSAAATSGIAAYASGILGYVEVTSSGNSSYVISIADCFNTGPITAYVRSNGPTTAYAGGIMGYLRGNVNSGTVVMYTRDCFNSGSIDAAASQGASAVAYAGGLVGGGRLLGTDDTIEATMQVENCYNDGRIEAVASVPTTAYAGGLVGYAYSEAVGNNNLSTVIAIVNSYSRGDIISSGYAGGAVGYVMKTGTPPKMALMIANCYYLTGTIMAPNSNGLSGNSTDISVGQSNANQNSGAKTASQMRPTQAQAQSNSSIYYTGSMNVRNSQGNGTRPFTGWNFSGTGAWVMVPGVNGINEGYPVLRATPQMTLTGTVIDDKSIEGIDGVEIWYEITLTGDASPITNPTESGPNTLRLATTNSMGQYIIKAPFDSTVKITKIYKESYVLVEEDDINDPAKYDLPGGLPKSFLMVAETSLTGTMPIVWDFIMMPPHIVTGTVLWDSPVGEIPLAGARITYETVDDVNDPTMIESGERTTDANGEFTIPVIHEGTITLFSIVRDGFIRDDAANIMSGYIEIDANDYYVIGPVTYDMDIELLMIPDGTISVTGMIFYEPEPEMIIPLGGAYVTYEYTDAHGAKTRLTTPAATGADGRYTLDVPSGCILEIIDVEREGFFDLTDSPTGPSQLSAANARLTLIIDPVDNVNFRMAPDPVNSDPYIVSGTVLYYHYEGLDDPHNGYIGVGNIRITYEIDGVEGYVITSLGDGVLDDLEEGEYEIEVPSGSHFVITDIKDEDSPAFYYLYPPEQILLGNIGYVTSDVSDVDFYLSSNEGVFQFVYGTVYWTYGGADIPIGGVSIIYTVNGLPATPVKTSLGDGVLDALNKGEYVIELTVGSRLDIIGLELSPYKVIDPAPAGGLDVPWRFYATYTYNDADFYMEIDTSLPFTVTGEVWLGPTTETSLHNVAISYIINEGETNERSGTVYTVQVNTSDPNSPYMYTIPVFAGDIVEITAVELFPYKLITPAPTAGNPVPVLLDVILDNVVDFDFCMEYDLSIDLVVFGAVYWLADPLQDVSVEYQIGTGAPITLTTEMRHIYRENKVNGSYIISSTPLTPPDSTYIGEMPVYYFNVKPGETAKISGVDYGQTFSLTNFREVPYVMSDIIADQIYIDFEIMPNGHPIEITVTVVDQDGDGIEDVLITYTVNGEEGYFDGEELPENWIAYEGYTDEDGVFVIDAASGDIITITSVWHEGYTLTSIGLDPLSPVPTGDPAEAGDLEDPWDMGIVTALNYLVDVEMEINPYTISGTVYKNGGVIPFENVEIYYTLNGDSEYDDGLGNMIPYKVLTESDGTYVIDAVYMDDVVITNVSYLGYRLMSTVPVEFEGMYKDETANFVLNEIYYITGKVFDQDDALMDDEDLTISYTINTVAQTPIATSDGTYSITAVYGDTVVITNVVHDDGGFTVKAGETPLTLASITSNKPNTDLYMDINEYDVVGYILDTFGNPVRGATITYILNGDDLAEPLPYVTSGENGMYVIELVYRDEIEIITVTHPGFTLTDVPIQVPLPLGPMTDDIREGADFEMLINPYDVEGYIFDTFGDPIEGATITYILNENNEGVLPYVTSGSDGKYVIGLVYLDEIEVVSVTHPGFTLTNDPSQVPLELGPMTADISTGTDFEMEINPYDVVGYILDTFGNPVEGATITYILNGDDLAEPLPYVTSGLDGRYVIELLYLDEIEIVSVTHPGFTLTVDPSQVPLELGPITDDIREGADFVMEINEYVISGVVYDLEGDNDPLADVLVTYTVNGGAPITLPATGADGAFEITAVYMDEVVVSLSKTGFKMDPVEQVMSFGPMTDDIEDVELYMSILRFNVTIDYTGGGVVLYTLNNGTPVEIVCNEDGIYVIENVAYGTDIVVTVLPNDKYTSLIEDDRGLFRDDTFFSTEVMGDLFLFATFTFIPDSGLFVWMLSLVLLSLFLVLLIVLLSRTGLVGAVTYGGEALEGVTVSYVMNGKEGTAVTDDNGKYKIKAAVGSEITINSVAKNGYSLNEGLPRQIKFEKGMSGIDFTMNG